MVIVRAVAGGGVQVRGVAPRGPGRGAAGAAATTTVLVAYDIKREAVRRRVAEACQDFGLVRIQWSVFLGPLDTRYHGRLMEALARPVAGQVGTIDCFMICAADAPRRRHLDGATIPAPAVPGKARRGAAPVRQARRA